MVDEFDGCRFQHEIFGGVQAPSYVSTLRPSRRGAGLIEHAGVGVDADDVAEVRRQSYGDLLRFAHPRSMSRPVPVGVVGRATARDRMAVSGYGTRELRVVSVPYR